MNTSMPYRDREEAGRMLGKRLASYASGPETIVLGLPRGGVPVALEVARILHAPLDVFLVRKLGLPSQPELAMGAIASGGVQVINEDLIHAAKVTASELAETLARETAELRRREELYRGDRPALRLQGRVVVLIDDGLATGASLRAAIAAVSAHHPAKLVVGVPVGAPDSCLSLATLVDELVCPLRPDPFYAVGCWYDHFGQTSDEEVRECLEAAKEPAGAGADQDFSSG